VEFLDVRGFDTDSSKRIPIVAVPAFMRCGEILPGIYKD
jgi:hypothetical protein